MTGQLQQILAATRSSFWMSTTAGEDTTLHSFAGDAYSRSRPHQPWLTQVWHLSGQTHEH